MIKYEMQEMTFLIIENDLQTAEVIAEALQSRGHSVFRATDGGQGVSMAEELRPSLIFLNLSTPGTNGLGICKTFKEIEALKNVPIILLTIREGKFDAMYKTLFGITGFLKKPITREAVLSKIDSLMPEIMGGKPSAARPAVKEEKQAAAYQVEEAGEPPLFQDIEEPEELPPDELPEESAGEKAPVFQAIEEAPRGEKEGPVEKALSLEETLEPEPEEEPSEAEGALEKTPVFQSIEEVKEAPAGKEPPLWEEKAPAGPKEEAPTKERLGELIEKLAPVHPERSFARKKILVYSISILAALGIILSVAYTVFVMEKDGGTPTGTPAKDFTLQTPPEPAQPVEPAQPAQAEAPPAVKEEAPVEAPEGPAPEGPAPEKARPEQAVAGAYYVQFGAFGVEANATGLSRKLKEKGLDVFIHKGATRRGRPLYRVLLTGGFDSAASASAEARKIRTSRKLDAAVFKIGP
jgi:DNA-binding response OmpR family regulator